MWLSCNLKLWKYCLVEILGKIVRIDWNGCESEYDLCFIDDNGLPHSADYPIKSYNSKYSTYSLKHLLETKTGIYLTNNQMKDALLNMGYTC